MIGVVVALALLGVAGVAISRSRDARPEAGWTEYPTRTPTPVLIDDAPVIQTPPDPFNESTTLVGTLPDVGDVRGIRLLDGAPGFLVGGRGVPTAFAAFGGPDHARVLVGWCTGSRTFQDANGTYIYDENGAEYGDINTTNLPGYAVRGAIEGGIEIAGISTLEAATSKPAAERPPRCPTALRYPDLPDRAESVHDTIEGFRVVNGRYVVTTESASFCSPVSKSGCAADGWEEYELSTLPGGDLAGSYTWEGDFVVHGDRDGNLTAVRLPGTRLVSRTDVGTSAVLGHVNEVVREDPLTLRVSVLDEARMTDTEREVVVNADANVFLGDGHTGLGRPRGDAGTLREYLRDPPGGGALLWFVLDAKGRAIRVVTHP